MLLHYLLILLIIHFGTSEGFDPTLYENSQEILPRYEVYWTVNQKDASISLALHVKTTGWVGFGIAEITSGSMPGSDIVLGYVENGKGTISDGWTATFALPYTDDCQVFALFLFFIRFSFPPTFNKDWKLIAAEEHDGYTTLELWRLLDTKDPQDRAIIAGPNRIVVAFGENYIEPPSYHGENRITSEITFYGETVEPPLPPDALFVDLQMPNFYVPNGATNYICKSFALPIDQQYSIIQIDPLVDEQNVERVHHFVAHICQNVTGGYVTEFSEAGDCFSPTGDIDSGCDDILMGWGAGGGPTVLPPDAGFPMGPNKESAKFIVLEIHYNNPDGIGGYTDTSGIRIWYTTKLRKYEAGILILGDPAILLPPIPPHLVTEYETECPAACTQTLSQEVHIWNSFPHMHQVGSQIWTTQWRDDKLIAEIGRVEYWAFEHQQTQFVDFILKPGDRLNTHCIYDATAKNIVTNFGLNSSDEMCMHLLGYYPRTPDGTLLCGYAPNMTLCSDASDSGLIPNTTTTLDPRGGEKRRFGVTPSTCPAEKPQVSQATIFSRTLNLVFVIFVCFGILFIV